MNVHQENPLTKQLSLVKDAQSVPAVECVCPGEVPLENWEEIFRVGNAYKVKPLKCYVLSKSINSSTLDIQLTCVCH